MQLEVSIMSLLFLLHLVQYQGETSNVLGTLYHKIEKKKAIKYIVYISTFVFIYDSSHNNHRYRNFIIQYLFNSIYYTLFHILVYPTCQTMLKNSKIDKGF